MFIVYLHTKIPNTELH